MSLRYASFQVLHSLCEIDSQCVENLRPCWHCCADTCCGLRCPWTPEVLPPPLLLTEPISTPCSFVSVCLCSKTLISHIQFRDGFVASTMKCPEKFLHAFGEMLIYYWPLSDKSVQLQSNKSFLQSPTFVVVQFCVVYATQNLNSYMRRLCVGCFLSCPRYSLNLFFLSVATALKRNRAQKENCSLTAVGSLKDFAAITHIKKAVFA